MLLLRKIPLFSINVNIAILYTIFLITTFLLTGCMYAGKNQSVNSGQTVMLPDCYVSMLE